MYTFIWPAIVTGKGSTPEHAFQQLLEDFRKIGTAMLEATPTHSHFPDDAVFVLSNLNLIHTVQVSKPTYPSIESSTYDLYIAYGMITEQK